MWWTCCPLYFKNSEIWLQGERCVNLPVLFLAVFGPNCMVWAFMILSLPSVIIPPHFTANKATWKKKCESSPSYFFSWCNLKNEGTETSPRRKLPSWWGPYTKAVFLIHLEAKCTLQQIPAAILLPLKANTASGNSMRHYGLVKAISGKYHSGTWEVGCTRSSSSYLLPTHTAQVH